VVSKLAQGFTGHWTLTTGFRMTRSSDDETSEGS
jgi:hypothetical protein